MNWKVIFSLSLFGLFMAVSTVYFIPTSVEWICWLVIFLLSAFVIARNCAGKFFLHGFLLSLVNCVWITVVHVFLYQHYAASHVEEMKQMATMPASLSRHPRLFMLISGPVIGAICGLVQGTLAWIASKIIRKNPALPA